jgi:uncharacterized protein YndB with AHSA1/START domain
MKILKIAAVILAILIISFLFVGIVSPSYEFTCSVQVKASPEKCWSVYQDTTQMKQWNEGFQSLKLKSGEYRKPGSVYELIIVQDKMYVMSQKLTDIQEPAHASFELDNDVMKSKYTFSFTREGNETLIQNHYHVTGNNPFWKSILFLSRTMIESKMNEELILLKKEIEKH